jgi:hypothetical protein
VKQKKALFEERMSTSSFVAMTSSSVLFERNNKEHIPSFIAVDVPIIQHWIKGFMKNL